MVVEAIMMSGINGLKRGEKAALIMSECQRAMIDADFVDRELARLVTQRRMISRLAALARAFRDAGLPVVHATLVPAADGEFPVNCSLMANVRKAGLLRKGLPGADIVSGLEPQSGDLVVERELGVSGFHATELERLLRARGVETVVLAGVSTNIALPTMAAEAVNRLFNVVFAEDCMSGGTAESHDAQLKWHLPLLGTVAASEEIAAAIAGAPGRR